jgi:hypothetical protein
MNGQRHAEIERHVVETLTRPVTERDAATEHVRFMELYADEWDDGPAWKGHALHRSFLAGVTWARQQLQKRAAG